jgi:hypothetical protein
MEVFQDIYAYGVWTVQYVLFVLGNSTLGTSVWGDPKWWIACISSLGIVLFVCQLAYWYRARLHDKRSSKFVDMAYVGREQYRAAEVEVHVRQERLALDAGGGHNFATSRFTFALSEEIKLRMGCPEDNQANRLSARSEGLRILRDWAAAPNPNADDEAAQQGGRAWGMRKTHLVSHLAHAVNLVFLPSHDDIVIGDMTRSSAWHRRRERLVHSPSSFLARLLWLRLSKRPPNSGT